jgi:hypothetical protein
MKEIKKIDILSIAKISGLLMGGIYLVAGLVVNVAVLIFKIPVTAKLDILGFGSGILATFMVALLIGAVNFIIGAIAGWLYNLTASVVGGIRIKLEDLVEHQIIQEIKKSKESPTMGHEDLISSSQPQAEVNHILQKSPSEFSQKSKEPRDTFSEERQA